MRASRLIGLAFPLVAMIVMRSAHAARAPTIVGTDPSGDWSSEASVATVGASMGQDLTQAAVTMTDDATMEFHIQVAGMPQFDPTLTGVYSWNFKAGRHRRTLVSCGNFIVDCEARDHFAVLGDCVTSDEDVTPPELDPIECERLGEVAATFLADGLISIPVPLDVLQVSHGTTLKMKGQYIMAHPYAFLISGPDPSVYSIDLMKTTENFTIRPELS